MENFNKTTRNRKSRLRYILPLFMCLLPLVVFNIGFHFITGIESLWHKQEKQETARQELETLSYAAVFTNRLEIEAARITDFLADHSNLISDKSAIKNRLSELTEQNLAPLLENFRFHVFESDSTGSHNLIYTSSPGTESRRAMGLIFDYIYKQNQGVEFSDEQRRKNDKIAEFFLGRNSTTEALATSLKGRATYVFQNNRPHWFIWNYTKLSDGKSRGFFVTAPVSEKHETVSRNLAVKESIKKGLGLPGFISLVSEKPEIISCSKLSQSNLLKKWVQKNLPSLDQNMRYYMVNGPPEPASLGDYTLYSHLAGDSPFLTVFLIRNPPPEKLPYWLWVINILSAALIILASIRILLLDKGISLSLTARFMTTYFLVASLPLGMLGITAMGYDMQITRTDKNNLANRIEAVMRNFETVQTSIDESYLNRTKKLFEDENLTRIIAAEGIKSEKVHRYISDHFATSSVELPLMGFILADISGETHINTPKENMQLMNLLFSVYRNPVIQNMRNNFSILYPGIKLPEFKVPEEEKLGSMAYEAIADMPMADQMEKRRAAPLTQKSAGNSATLMFEYLNIKGRQTVVLFVIWDPHTLFEKKVAVEIEKLQKAQSEYAFMAFKKHLHGLKSMVPAIPEQRHLLRYAAQIAEITTRKSSASREHHNDLTQIAMPFGAASSVIITGAASHDNIIRSSVTRRNILWLVILISLAITLFSAFVMAGNLLRPLLDLKSALRRVINGELETNLHSDRSDELGSLTKAFSGMIKGLQERERLASMLSDHAVEAVSSSADSSRTSDTEFREFSGTALVSDIRNFTVLCSNHESDEIISLLNEHFAGMTEAITRNGGRIYKFVGDAIEAVFSDNDSENSAEAAFRASVAMLSKIDEINSRRSARGLFTYKAGIGLAMGSFTAGTLGNENVRLDYSIMGDTFEKASECEAATKLNPDFPVVLCQKVAQKLADKIDFFEISDSSCLFSTKTENALIKELRANSQKDKFEPQNNPSIIPLREKDPLNNSLPSHSYGRKMLAGILLLFSFLGIFTAYSVMNQRNSMLMNEFNQEETKRLTEIAKQLQAAKSGHLAFELLIQREFKRIQKNLSFNYLPQEEQYLVEQVKQLQDNLLKSGCKPVRVVLTTYSPTKPGEEMASYTGKISYTQNLSTDHAEKINALNESQYGRIYSRSRDKQLEKLGNFCPELFSLNVTPEFLVYEKFGAPIAVKNGTKREVLFWSQLQVSAPWFSELKATEPNALLSETRRDYRRIAAFLLITIEAESAEASPQLIVDAFSDNVTEIAVLSKNHTVLAKSALFPDLFSSPEALSRFEKPLVKTRLMLNNEKTDAIIISSLKNERVIPEEIINLTSATACLIILFFFFSPGCKSILKNYISAQLYLSILIIAVIPVFAMSMTSDFFLNADLSANLLKNRNYIRSFLDELEIRPQLSRSNIKRQLLSYSKKEELLRILADSASDSQDLFRKKLNRYFSRSFKELSTNEGWINNFRPREVFLAGRNQSAYHYSQSGRESPLSEALKEICRHILKNINSNNNQSGQMIKEVKGEMLFQTLTGSIRSNFGANAFQKLANALGEFIELEVTTGSAGLLFAPLPGFETPENLLLWLVNVRTQGFLTDIARYLSSPVKVFSYDFLSYGLVNSRLRPAPGLELEKAIALMNATNQAISYVAEVNGEKISVEGRPGIRQINNFLIGALPQTHAREANKNLKNMFIALLILSTMLFLIISHHTAADMLIPINDLINGTKAIDCQNYCFRVNSSRKDELGELCSLFNIFSKGLLEKEKMRSMVSIRARKAAIETGISDENTGKTRQHCAMIFIDSCLAETLKVSKTEYFDKLKMQISEICRIIGEEGGDIDKILGSRILGVFSATSEDSDNICQKALSAGKAIISAAADNKLPLNFYAGIHYGEVISGMVGFGSKFDFTVIGDAVNVTARIQKAAEINEDSAILFSEDFIRQIKIPENFTLHSETGLKGKSQVWRLFKLPC